MTAVDRPLFGALALCKGHCTLDELDVALDAQRETTPQPPLGQILVDMGKLTSDQVEGLLQEQNAKLPGKSALNLAPAAVESAPSGSRMKALLARVHGAVGRLLPFLHPHRSYVLLVALPGLCAIVLGWRLLKSGVWVHGVQGPGWLSFLLLGAAGGWLMLGDRPKALSRRDRAVALAVSGLAVLAGLWKLFSTPDEAVAMGIGVPLAFLSALAVHGILWPMKAVDGDPERSPLARMKRAWNDLSGKRAKEQAVLVERRDALLKKIGEAALLTPADSDPELVKKARQAVDVPGKPVPGKRERALLRLGRAAADAGLADKALAEELNQVLIK